MEGSVYKQVVKRNGKSYKYYIGQFTIDNIRYSVSAKSEADCWRKMNDKRSNLNSKKLGNILLIDWLIEYIRLYKKNNDVKNVIAMQRMVERLSFKYGKLYLKNFNINYAQALINDYCDKSNTQKKLYDLIRSALDKAVLLGYIDKNVMYYVEIKKHKSVKHRAYEFEEQNKIIELLIPKYRSAFYILCCTCMRIGEFLAFNPATDIDEERHKLIINKRLDIITGKVHIGLKNGDDCRYVDYIDDLFIKAKELGNGYLPFGKITYSGIKCAMQKVLLQLGIKDCLLHTTRHTGLSVGHYCKIDDIRLQYWAGHKSLTMTKDTYTSLLDKGCSPILEYYQKLAKKFEF